MADSVVFTHVQTCTHVDTNIDFQNTYHTICHIRDVLLIIIILMLALYNPALLQLGPPCLPKAPQVLFFSFIFVCFASPRVIRDNKSSCLLQLVCVKSLSPHNNDSDLNNGPYLMHNATSNCVFSKSPNMYFTYMHGGHIHWSHTLIIDTHKFLFSFEAYLKSYWGKIQSRTGIIVAIMVGGGQIKK